MKALIREIPDFPLPGILFRDITPLLRDPEAFRYVIDQLSARFGDHQLDAIVAVESRGFLFGATAGPPDGLAFGPGAQAG